MYIQELRIGQPAANRRPYSSKLTWTLARLNVELQSTHVKP